MSTPWHQKLRQLAALVVRDRPDLAIAVVDVLVSHMEWCGDHYERTNNYIVGAFEAIDFFVNHSNQPDYDIDDIDDTKTEPNHRRLEGRPPGNTSSYGGTVESIKDVCLDRRGYVVAQPRPTNGPDIAAEQHGNANKPGQGVKFDHGKPKFDFIPFDLLAGENRVWAKGALKYGPSQWRKGMPMTQPFNALLRHLFAFMRGEDNDPETGESHLDHAACCLRMMQNTKAYYPHHDDRNKWAPPEKSA